MNNLLEHLLLMLYGEESNNMEMFNGSFRKVVSAVSEGFNATIFAYG